MLVVASCLLHDQRERGARSPRTHRLTLLAIVCSEAVSFPCFSPVLPDPPKVCCQEEQDYKITSSYQETDVMSKKC